MNRSEYSANLELQPLQRAPSWTQPSRVARPAKRKTYPLTLATLVGALVGFAIHILTHV
jgi:hypothetical protein